MMTDPLGDLLTRIRNANHASLEMVEIPHSKLKEAVARVIKDEGFLADVQVVGTGIQKNIVVTLKYPSRKTRTITGMSRVSKPGRRVYISHDDLKMVRNGMGILVLSTSKGVMTDATARQQHLGGEAICKVW